MVDLKKQINTKIVFMKKLLFASFLFTMSLVYSQNKIYKAGEIYTQNIYQYGKMEVRMLAATGSGVISNFFTFKEGSELASTFWEEIDIEDVPPEKKLIGSRWVFKKKPNGIYRARLVALGYLQTPGVDYTESYAPVIQDTTL